MEADIADRMPPLSTADSPLSSNPDHASMSGGRFRRAEALLTPERRKLAAQFLRFGIVGGLGFLWDTATVYSMRHVIGLSGAAILAYFVAASMNWLVNRLWTFRGTGSAGSMWRQWGAFLAANSLGFVLNRGTVLALTHTVPLCYAYPVLALMAGTLAGMFSNFTMSRRLVFR